MASTRLLLVAVTDQAILPYISHPRYRECGFEQHQKSGQIRHFSIQYHERVLD
jgi:hypothetical protein